MVRLTEERMVRTCSEFVCSSQISYVSTGDQIYEPPIFYIYQKDSLVSDTMIWFFFIAFGFIGTACFLFPAFSILCFLIFVSDFSFCLLFRSFLFLVPT
jgi:hypothetical protein